jgi:DNA-binding MarR family transcriptional regulator
VTRLVDRLVEAGLMVRDRRSIHVVLTRARHEVVERAIAAQSIDHRLMTPLNDDDRAALTGALARTVRRTRGTGFTLTT